MSVPMLLQILNPNNGAATQAAAEEATTNAAAVAAAAAAMTTPTLLLDDHIKNCVSYAEAASTLASKYGATTINALDVADTTKSSSDDSCPHILRKFTVELNGDLEPNEHVGLTGDSKALGSWQVDRCIMLRPVGPRKWSASTIIESCRNISYRYFVYVTDRQGRKQIRRWETQLQPRTLPPGEAATQGGDAGEQIDRFGVHGGGKSASSQVNRGWLTKERIVQLKLEREHVFQVQDIDKFDPENIRMQIVPLKEDMVTALDNHAAGVNIEVAKLKYGESLLQPQPNFGVSYKRGDIVIFHVTMPADLESSFGLVFYAADNKLVGQAVIKADQLTGSEGDLVLPITEATSERHNDATGAPKTIARLHLPYLIVKPFAEAELDFRTTYAHYWPKSWPNLDVGHRGNGRSFIADPPAEHENTLASFKSAYENFADMIELDVHLTADGVPIIYHDFGVRTAPKGKQITSSTQLEYVLIKDLTYEAVKNLRVFALINNKPVEYLSHYAEPRPDHRIFPTLAEVLEGTPKSLGIDVEIKWPQRRAHGGVEADQTIDKNFFIDRVLGTIITYGCGRPLLFSSFDADVCTMLRFKQNRFPVIFLTMGETKKWAQFMDLRTRTFEQAVNMAQAFELAGTAPHAEDFLDQNGAELIQLAHNLAQITLVWGDDCNSKERVKYFGEIGATAICYDRTDLYVPDKKERAFFNSTTLMAEFEEQCLF